MEAPDKLYLWETPIINGGYDPAWHKNSFNDSDVEYIRKDKILDILENSKHLVDAASIIVKIDKL